MFEVCIGSPNGTFSVCLDVSGYFSQLLKQNTIYIHKYPQIYLSHMLVLTFNHIHIYILTNTKGV